MSQPPLDPPRGRPQPYGGHQPHDSHYDPPLYGGHQQADPPLYGGHQPQYAAQPGYQPRSSQQPAAPQAAPQRLPPAPGGGGRPRIPGLGLLLTLAGLVVQALSLFVLPWLNYGASGSAMSDVWSLAAGEGANGFGEWYVLLFTYPLVGLGILLAFAAVLESVALKVIWGALTVVGLGVLVLRYGFGPFADVAETPPGDLGFTTQQITIGIIALVVLILVIFALKMAVTMFRRVAMLILLVLAGVHIAAVFDLAKTSGEAELSIGAFGPAAGYVLCALAAIAPRRLPGL